MQIRYEDRGKLCARLLSAAVLECWIAGLQGLSANACIIVLRGAPRALSHNPPSPWIVADHPLAKQTHPNAPKHTQTHPNTPKGRERPRPLLSLSVFHMVKRNSCTFRIFEIPRILLFTYSLQLVFLPSLHTTPIPMYFPCGESRIRPFFPLHLSSRCRCSCDSATLRGTAGRYVLLTARRSHDSCSFSYRPPCLCRHRRICLRHRATFQLPARCLIMSENRTPACAHQQGFSQTAVYGILEDARSLPVVFPMPGCNLRNP